MKSVTKTIQIPETLEDFTRTGVFIECLAHLNDEGNIKNAHARIDDRFGDVQAPDDKVKAHAVLDFFTICLAMVHALDRMPLGDFQNEVNMPLHDTRIRFGMARQFARHIDLVALAPSKIGGMETLELAAYFDEDKPRYHLAIFDTGMSKRAEYSFHSIVDPKIGLLALLKDEYGDEIKFTENR